MHTEAVAAIFANASAASILFCSFGFLFGSSAFLFGSSVFLFRLLFCFLFCFLCVFVVLFVCSSTAATIGLLMLLLLLLFRLGCLFFCLVRLREDAMRHWSASHRGIVLHYIFQVCCLKCRLCSFVSML